MTGNHHRPGPLARANEWLIRWTPVAWFNLKAAWAIPTHWWAERIKAREQGGNPWGTDGPIAVLEAAERDAVNSPPGSGERLLTGDDLGAGLGFDMPEQPVNLTTRTPSGVTVWLEPEPEPDWEQAQVADLERYVADRTAEHFRWLDAMHVATLGHVDEQVAA